jgi:hypothetical protein
VIVETHHPIVYFLDIITIMWHIRQNTLSN